MVMERSIDEFAGYANGDGTFNVEMHGWFKNIKNELKPTTIKIEHMHISDATISMAIGGGPTFDATINGEVQITINE